MSGDVKPGYKQTEVGVIPEDWDDPQLDEIAKDDSPICYGIVQVGPYTRNGIPVLAIKNLNSDYTTNIHKTSANIERPYVRSRIRPGDVLISVKGTTGRVGIVPDSFHGNISRDIARLRLREEIVPGFCFQMLQSDMAQKRLAVAVVGTTRMELSIAVLKKVRIPLPPTKAEQEAIAEALSDADALIDSLTQLIAKKRQIKQGAMQELLTGKRRLHGFANATIGYKQTEIGVIPADWDCKTIDEVGFVTSGKRLPLGSALTEQHTPHPYIRVTDMRPGTVSLSDIKFVPDEVYPAIKRYRIFREDIFISVAGTLGIVGKIPQELDGANLTENADRITNITCSQDYLLHVLMSPLIQNTIESLQTIGAQPKLALTRIRKFVIPLPPTKAEQEAIAEVLSEMDVEITALETKLAKARQLKQGMMHNLLTGRIRLV
jgi:type I restriction enzyme, S subunit